MKSFKETIYLHRDKEDNWGIQQRYKEEFGVESHDVLYIGCELPIEIEIFEDGTCKCLSVDGKDVGSLGINV